MKKISFDSGVQEFQINENGVLRFNPSDLNVYNRFIEATDEIKKIESTLVAKGKELGEKPSGADIIKLMHEADQQIKEVLVGVFGAQNDFDQIMGGVNLMSVAGNGERVITNFFAAISPIMEEGVKKFADAEAEKAKAGMNRAQRRAASKAKK